MIVTLLGHLHEFLVIPAQLVDLAVEFVQLVVLKEDRLDLILEIFTTQVKRDQELLVLSEEVVEDA